MSVFNDVQSILGNIVNKAVVRITGAAGTVGINGFVFDVIGDEENTLEADITDHYVETNSSIQDHIALKPIRFTLTGFVGELNSGLASSLANTLTNITNKVVGPFFPSFTTQAEQVYQKLANKAQKAATLANNILNQAQSLYGIYKGAQTSATRQQAAYNMFLQLWMNQRYSSLNLCTVETPWGVMQNMAVEHVRILNRDDNFFVSEFAVTFKEMRFVDVQVSKPAFNQDKAITQGVAAVIPKKVAPVSNMTAAVVNHGLTTGSSMQSGASLSYLGLFHPAYLP